MYSNQQVGLQCTMVLDISLMVLAAMGCTAMPATTTVAGKTADKTLNRAIHNLELDHWYAPTTLCCATVQSLRLTAVRLCRSLQYVGQPATTKLPAIVTSLIEAEVSSGIREFLLLLGLKYACITEPSTAGVAHSCRLTHTPLCTAEWNGSTCRRVGCSDTTSM
jgi:hypothetical protein